MAERVKESNPANYGRRLGDISKGREMKLGRDSGVFCCPRCGKTVPRYFDKGGQTPPPCLRRGRENGIIRRY